MVNPRDIAGNEKEEVTQPTSLLMILSSSSWPFILLSLLPLSPSSSSSSLLLHLSLPAASVLMSKWSIIDWLSHTAATCLTVRVTSGYKCSLLAPSRALLAWRQVGVWLCNEWHSFHARVGRFSPFLYLRSVAIAVILFWLRLVVLVSPCFLGSRIPRDYCFPPAPLFLCSERKSS